MFICLTKNRDGSHGFQVGGTQQPGWAYLPEGLERPATFPFVNIETAQITYPSTATRQGFTRLEVVAMTEGEAIKENVSESDTEEENATVYDEMAAAYTEGVQSA